MPTWKNNASKKPRVRVGVAIAQGNGAIQANHFSESQGFRQAICSHIMIFLFRDKYIDWYTFREP